MTDESTPHLMRGILLFSQRRFQDAIKEFQAELAQEPNNAYAHAWIGNCFDELEQYDQAEEAARNAIELDPHEDFAYFVLGCVNLSRNRLPEAREALNRAIEIVPQNATYWSQLAAVEFRASRYQAALETADRALEFDPEHENALNFRAMALTQLGRRDEAAQTIEQALAQSPENSFTHANSGWAELHAGNAKKAMEHFREALRLDPENDFARSGIAEAMKARNFIYRGMLAYFLWMSRLPEQWRYGVIFLIFMGPGLLKRFTGNNPELAMLAAGLSTLVTVFAMLTWIADPLFNMVLRFDRFGKHALSREQINAANLLAIFLIPTAIFFFASYLLPSPYRSQAFVLCVFTSVALLPASQVYNCEVGWPRNAMWAYFAATCCLMVAGYYLVGWLLFGISEIRTVEEKTAMLKSDHMRWFLKSHSIATNSWIVTWLVSMWLTAVKVRR